MSEDDTPAARKSASRRDCFLRQYDAQGDLTTWEYQPLTGLLLWKQDAAGEKTIYQYDALGRVSSRLDPRGVETKYEYYAQSDSPEGAFTGALRKVDQNCTGQPIARRGPRASRVLFIKKSALDSFLATNPCVEGKLAYIRLNTQAPSPPRGAVPAT